MGLLGDYAIGAALGVPIVYMLRYTGRDYAALKGLGIGHLGWISMFGFLGGGFSAKTGVFPLDAGTNFSAIVNHSWYGMVTSCVAAKLGDPGVFAEPPAQKQGITSTREIPALPDTRYNTTVRPFRQRRQ